MSILPLRKPPNEEDVRRDQRWPSKIGSRRGWIATNIIITLEGVWREPAQWTKARYFTSDNGLSHFLSVYSSSLELWIPSLSMQFMPTAVTQRSSVWPFFSSYSEQAYNLHENAGRYRRTNIQGTGINFLSLPNGGIENNWLCFRFLYEGSAE